MNNQEFSLARKYLRRENLNYDPDFCFVVPRELWPSVAPGHRKPNRVLRSRDFLIQEYTEENDIIRLSVVRTELERNGNWKDGLTWDDLNKIKFMAGYADWYGVEVFPPTGDIVNVANMRHLWLMRTPLPIGWTNKGKQCHES